MAKLTPAQVRHIAKLARLQLSDDEVERYATELTRILEYVDMLGEVDTKNVSPTAQVAGLQNSWREDSIRPSLAEPDALLHTSPLPVYDRQIASPSAHN